tara:strand:- start:587 stop:784 length:198 start_codon:yes stop_codon:yes gene_type:complete
MGYHKKFITEELLRSIYENDGYQLMIENITKAEAIYIGDDFSEKIIELITENTSEEKIKEFFELN